MQDMQAGRVAGWSPSFASNGCYGLNASDASWHRSRDGCRNGTLVVQ